MALSLDSYAAALRKLGRTAEAEQLETRARAIREKRRSVVNRMLGGEDD